MKEKYSKLLNPYRLGELFLANRIVMAPMTRSRAIDNLPNDLLTEYYSQRATAGLIIAEGTSPSPNGLGYARIPGLYSDKQVTRWKEVTDSVHARGGKIFVQLMHTGRITHPLNQPAGASIVAPSAIGATTTQMYTDSQGMQPLPVPEAILPDEVSATIAEFVQSARAAIKAGFDGVELHGANGYLLDQFLNPASNKRDDKYGGSADNRNRFVVEVAQAVANAIGKDRTGIRLSPFGVFNDMTSDDTTETQFISLASALRETGIVYIHIVDHSAMGGPVVPQSTKDSIRKAFGGNIIISGGYDAARAEDDLAAGRGDLVAFGRPFISNPDLVNKFQTGAALTEPDFATFYTAGVKGYTDYENHTLN